MILTAYRALSRLAGPALRRHAAHRAIQGKEEAARLGERFGVAGRPRPAGKLIWLHGASVGETQSLRPLIAALAARDTACSFLVTSGTVTAATLFDKAPPPRSHHAYLPYDHPDWVAAFLDHWRPDLAIFVESELWPNLLQAIGRRKIPAALLNARLSPRSARRWRWAAETARRLFGKFDLILAADREQQRRLAHLGVSAPTSGNLKAAAPILPVDPQAEAALQRARAGRPIFLAASTHEGEERALLPLLRALATRRPPVLSILAPRHPARGDAIVALFAEAGLPAGQRGRGDWPSAEAPIFIADSLGELGAYFAAADLVFLGGALIAAGGHNPLEPARFGKAILTGPATYNFADLFARLIAAGGAEACSNAEELRDRTLALIDDGPRRAAMGRAALTFAEAESGSLERILVALEPLLARAGLGNATGGHDAHA